jgi:CBS domain-containing protein
MRVREIMSPQPQTCRVHDTAKRAAEIMWEHDCGVVPVVDDDGRVCGIVTDRDLCMAAYFQGTTLADIPVSAAMSREVISCSPDDPIAHAERLMGERQVHRLPVVDDRQSPIGLLSLSDVARRVSQSGTSRLQEGREFLETMAAICQPRTVTHH